MQRALPRIALAAAALATTASAAPSPAAAATDCVTRSGAYPDAAPSPADDVGFVDAMVGELGSQLSIDPTRVYASGFSNGANFTARLSANPLPSEAARNGIIAILIGVHEGRQPPETFTPPIGTDKGSVLPGG